MSGLKGREVDDDGLCHGVGRSKRTPANRAVWLIVSIQGRE